MKQLISEKDIVAIVKKGEKTFFVESDYLVTPLAMDLIREHKIVISNKKQETINQEQKILNFSGILKIAIGSDHTGFQAKTMVIKYLSEKGYNIKDFGTDSDKACDYPDFAFAVAKSVALKEVDFGILLDATGIPSSITANKLPGIRAATCYNEFTAKSAREHNNSNIIVMGAKMLGDELIKSLLNVWTTASFLGERHQKRLDKITEIEKYFIKDKF